MAKAGRADYGFDAPGEVLALVLAAGATTIVGFVVRRFVLLAAVFLWVWAGGMAWSSRVGKGRMARQLVESIAWTGNERVLDVGCGRGLLLNEAAGRLTSGRAVGVDLWSRKDQSGNTPGATRRNASCEGVSDRIDILTADASSLPFCDGAFDIVVSGLALHNIRDWDARQRAMRELARVLRPGGTVAVFDILRSREYVQELAAGGLTSVARTGIRPLFFMPTRTVTAQRSSG